MKPEKREAIVAEAARAFARHGFRKASVDAIAKSAGVAKGTIYLACSSKRDLFYQAILRDLREWNAELSQQIDPRTPADRLLREISEATVMSAQRYPLAKGLLLGEYDPVLPDWADHLDDLRASGTGTIAEILRIGIRQGIFKEDLDVEVVAGVLLDVTTSTIMFHTRSAAALDRLPRRAEAAFDLVLHGLLPRVPAAVP